MACAMQIMELSTPLLNLRWLLLELDAAESFLFKMVNLGFLFVFGTVRFLFSFFLGYAGYRTPSELVAALFGHAPLCAHCYAIPRWSPCRYLLAFIPLAPSPSYTYANMALGYLFLLLQVGWFLGLVKSVTKKRRIKIHSE